MEKRRIAALGGGGFEDGEMMPVFKRIVEMAEKPAPKVLSLPTAGHDNIGGEATLETIFKGLGCSEFRTITLTNTELSEKEIHDAIVGSDIVFAGGGNLAFLMEVWNSSGASDALREAFEKGVVLSGVSSGAMCWFDEGYDDCGEQNAFEFVDCLGFLPYCNCPHFENQYWQSFIEAVKSRSRSGIACENGAALIYCDGKYEVAAGTKGGAVWLLDADRNFRMSRVENGSL
ncbi:MAG: Type 1 glutamine amidotransferase-like domain-containing protein [Clostridiales bacterium]|nr:Type 1 glutamine amidotransferase-like domain-containing protein [Clostridiales bacterium]